MFIVLEHPYDITSPSSIQSTVTTSKRQQLPHLLAFSNSLLCCLAYRTPPKLSNVSWTRSLKTKNSVSHISSLAVPPPLEHDLHLRILFTQLQNHGILLNPSKCVFRVPEISFLGYKISSTGCQPLPEQVAALPQPDEDVWYPPMQDDPPPPRSQWPRGTAAPHARRHVKI